MILWGVSAYLAGYEIFLSRSIVSRLYLLTLVYYSIPINVLERLSATGIGNVSSLLMAIIAIAIVVGGFDFHWMYGGSKRSFTVLGLTLIPQFIFLAIYIWLP